MGIAVAEYRRKTGQSIAKKIRIDRSNRPLGIRIIKKRAQTHQENLSFNPDNASNKAVEKGNHLLVI
jgi:hypothetical protein